MSPTPPIQNALTDSANPLEQIGSAAKRPRQVMSQENEAGFHAIYAFPPNRDTLGGTAYLIVDEVNILVDCPAWDEANRTFLHEHGGVDWLFLTHRGGIGKVREMQQTLGCNVAIQEQEAYLLPGVTVTSFNRSLTLTNQTDAIWTPGHSPGSACLYYRQFGGVLFSGRHLLPNPEGILMPLKTSTTFHWQRQLRSVQALINSLTPDTLQWVCPGANLGFLRGKQAVGRAYTQLSEIRL